MAKDPTNTKYSLTDILIIIAYLAILLVIAVLIWRFVSPILSIIVAGLIAYVMDIRKLTGRKN